MKKLKIVLIICFSFIFFGCRTQNIRSSMYNEVWVLPEKPQLSKVDGFTPVNGGFFIDKENANKLVDNVDEMKAYIEKLELLISKMKEYYK